MKTIKFMQEIMFTPGCDHLNMFCFSKELCEVLEKAGFKIVDSDFCICDGEEK